MAEASARALHWACEGWVLTVVDEFNTSQGEAAKVKEAGKFVVGDLVLGAFWGSQGGWVELERPWEVALGLPLADFLQSKVYFFLSISPVPLNPAGDRRGCIWSR